MNLKLKKDYPSLILKKVSKSYWLPTSKTFKEWVQQILFGEKTNQHFLALKNINLEIKRGETVGIVGNNGEGKSTIMKLIAGVSYPSTGILKVKGKVAPLIELGAGFHYELSGHENIFLNGAILGLSRREVDKIYPEIVTFSELGEFIDQPLKRYSTGMVMRLAFSIAIFASADILLLDEVLAVGDQAFQRKCLKKLRALKKTGEKIIIFISHDLDTLHRFCDRVIWIENHQVKMDGKSILVVRKYWDTLQ